MSEKEHLNIIIADDHEIIRTGIRLMLQEHFNLTMFEANNGTELMEAVKKSNPDIILMDINMPDTNTPGILESMLCMKPLLNVLVFSVNKEEIYGKMFLKLGARGYLQKDTTSAEIVKAIKSIMLGNIYMSREMQSYYIQKKNEDISPYAQLSERELEILGHLITGDSLLNIAKIMHLSSSTVGTHKAHIFSKLRVSNLLELREFVGIHSLK